ncbi:MAG TPA: peptidoglycan DD-metalloendopeptidase family protein [Burkholderiales bacterium]|nr:peptidoglycan DD-metalloendopeptidase family protein [Burkholderiales bacterium]
MRLAGFLLAALAGALLAACASTYRAPVVERTVTRAAARPVPQEQRPETYTVKRGDTLYSIALDKGLDYRDLAAWNEISDPSVLKPGFVLRLRPPGSVAAAQAGARVPSEPSVQVQPVTTPGSLEERSLGVDARVPVAPPRPGVEPRSGAETPRVGGDLLKTGPKAVKMPYSEENLAMMLRQSPQVPEPKLDSPSPPSSAAAESDGVDWMWPATGRVLAGFSEATNRGLDIVGKIGDPVFASASGRVVYSGAGLRGYGKLIIIKHNETYLSAYAHNSNLLVKEGQNVVKGQKIAEIGNSDSPQVKLHFEIRRLGKPVDPLKFLPERRS